MIVVGPPLIAPWSIDSYMAFSLLQDWVVSVEDTQWVTEGRPVKQNLEPDRTADNLDHVSEG